MKMKEKHPNYNYTTKDIQSFECVSCGFEIKMGDPLSYRESFKFEELIFDGGVIEKMYAGFGSKYDGDIFYLAICDECIKKKKKQGRILIINNYMGAKIDLDEENKEFNKNIIRKNKLKKIVKDEN